MYGGNESSNWFLAWSDWNLRFLTACFWCWSYKNFWYKYRLYPWLWACMWWSFSQTLLNIWFGKSYSFFDSGDNNMHSDFSHSNDLIELVRWWQFDTVGNTIPMEHQNKYRRNQIQRCLANTMYSSEFNFHITRLFDWSFWCWHFCWTILWTCNCD